MPGSGLHSVISELSSHRSSKTGGVVCALPSTGVPFVELTGLLPHVVIDRGTQVDGIEGGQLPTAAITSRRRDNMPVCRSRRRPIRPCFVTGWLPAVLRSVRCSARLVLLQTGLQRCTDIDIFFRLQCICCSRGLHHLTLHPSYIGTVGSILSRTPYGNFLRQHQSSAHRYRYSCSSLQT